MAGFPPKKGGNTAPIKVVNNVSTISTGSGGLSVSKALKNANITPSPGIEKVNSAS